MTSRKNIAVLIPCYNEVKTISKVIKDIKKELPNAKIYVYDNNSNDGTDKAAKKAGAIVKYEYKQGKGNVIRSMFKDIEADCYFMIDGDDTYSCSDIKKMCDMILKDEADMVIGDRLSSTYFEENKKIIHSFGNRFVRLLVNLLFKSNVKDILTGGRAFSRNFVKSIVIESNQFEVETEMTIYAIVNNYRIKDVPIIYKDRIKGSKSKIKTFKDGSKIIRTVFRLFKKYKQK